MNDRKSNWKWNVSAIATVLAATAATASAQEIITLKGNIPFQFSINRKANLAPGNYVITRERNVWYFRSADYRSSVAIVNAFRLDIRIGEPPSLAFDCVGKQCWLRAIRPTDGEQAVELPPSSVRNSDKAEVAGVKVALSRSRGE